MSLFQGEDDNSKEHLLQKISKEGPSAAVGNCNFDGYILYEELLKTACKLSLFRWKNSARKLGVTEIVALDCMDDEPHWKARILEPEGGVSKNSYK